MEVSLLDQYKKQWNLRDWDSLYNFLPKLHGSLVYDVGCAHGDHAEKLSSLGAIVTGLDGNEELLNFALTRNLPNTTFKKCDLREIDKMNLIPADGVWMSFVAAYFTDLKTQLMKISKILKPGGWIAITEMSGLFDHLPLDENYQNKMREFYKLRYENGHYDFYSGSKIKQYLLDSGYKIYAETFLKDHEFSKQGPCSDEVMEAWKNRLDRMTGLQQFLGNEFLAFEREFLGCLKSENHISNCHVYFNLAVKK